jgi:hypothetical protein
LIKLPTLSLRISPPHYLPSQTPHENIIAIDALAFAHNYRSSFTFPPSIPAATKTAGLRCRFLGPLLRHLLRPLASQL